MRKQEFLEKLYDALCESMDKNEAQKHVKYYRNYIDEKVREGKKEKDIIEELNNPRLIAKSIIDAGEDAFKYSDDVWKQNPVYDNNNEEKHSFSKEEHNTKGKWIFFAIFLFTIFIILSIVWAAVGTIVLIGKIIIKFIVPITIGIGIYMIYKIIKNDK